MRHEQRDEPTAIFLGTGKVADLQASIDSSAAALRRAEWTLPSRNRGHYTIGNVAPNLLFVFRRWVKMRSAQRLKRVFTDPRH